MKLIAITECPQGQRPGQVFDATDEAAQVLIDVGAARAYLPADDAVPAPTSRRAYRRRDLTAEETEG
jgi:hypothetical protein